jgi:iron complex outermembrane receptor protein
MKLNFLFLLLLLPLAANAQSGGKTLEEIVVTAQKREQRVQDMPTTVTVVSGLELAKFQITELEDLDAIVPGLVFNRTPGDNVAITIRGIGTFSGQQSFEQSVISYIDGIYGGFQKDYSIALYDLERVEVLKGTQSGILGKNASVGALNIVTRKPGNELGGYMAALYESENPGWGTEGAVDLPISDNFRVRLAGLYRDDDGYALNVISGRKIPQKEVYSGRVNAVWDVSDKITATLMAQYDNRDLVGNTQSIVGDDPGGVVSAADPRFVPGQGVEELVIFSGNLPVGVQDDAIDETESFRSSLTIDAGIGEHTFTSVTAGSSTDNVFTVDFDFFTARQYFDQTGDFSEFSQELRLASPSAQRFSYIAGLYYLHTEWDRIFDTVHGEGGFWTRIPFEQDVDTFSIFGKGDYNLTEKVTASASVRWVTEEKDAVIESFAPPGSGFVPWPVVFTPFQRTEQSRSPDFVDWGLSLQYSPSDQVMMYASFNKGTKTGGFADITGNVVNNANEVDDEIAYSWEVGTKLTLADGAANLNLAAWYMEVDDFQEAIVVAGTFVTRNIDLESQGIEVQATWLATEYLILGGTLTYVDSEDVDTQLTTLRSPEWNGNVRIDYGRPIQNTRFTWNAAIQAFYRDEYFNTPGVTFNMATSRSVLDLTLGVEHESGWSVALVGKNVTDEIDCGHGSFSALFGQGEGLQLCTLERPRTIALEGRYNF